MTIDVEETVKNVLGFIVVDGHTTLYGTVTGKGNRREVVHEFEANIPTKYGRGGQSSLEFANLRTKAHRDYIKKIAELATQVFINPETEEPNVAGLILAGTARYEAYLSGPDDPFDHRLLASILNGVPDYSNPVMAKILRAVSDSCGGGMAFDPRLRAKILNVVVVPCGGENGFDEAIAKIV